MVQTRRTVKVRFSVFAVLILTILSLTGCGSAGAYQKISKTVVPYCNGMHEAIDASKLAWSKDGSGSFCLKASAAKVVAGAVIKENNLTSKVESGVCKIRHAQTAEYKALLDKIEKVCG